MQKIRLSRTGRTNLAMYRVVLTEHTKPVKAGYTEVLGRFDPVKHILDVNVQRAKELVAKGVQCSPRIAKLLFNQSKDEAFKAFVEFKTRTRTTKKEAK